MKAIFTFLVSITICVLIPIDVNAQGIAINGDGAAPNVNAILDIQSTDMGILIPRMSFIARENYGLTLGVGEKGMLVFDSDLNEFMCWSGTDFVKVNLNTELADADDDTKIEVEQSPDDDRIWFTLGGTPKWRMINSRLESVNTGGSVFVGFNAGWADDGTDNANVGIGRFALSKSDDRSGLVAVGDSALYKNGDGAVSGFAGTLNTAIGSTVLKNNTSGSANTATGAGAMKSNIDGSNNTADGVLSLYSNTTGDNNSAIGVLSMYSNTSGDGNTAMGHLSLSSNTTGDDNVAVGRQTLSDNTSGSNNIALGRYAMRNNESGNFNIGLGLRTMYNATDRSNNIAVGDSTLFKTGQGAEQSWHGTYNIAVGKKSLYNNTSGYYNIGLGILSLEANTTGSNNIAIGRIALWNNTTGYDNIAIGRWALKDNVAGTSNIALGIKAMDGLDDGNFNIAIGTDAMSILNEGNYNIAIGDNSMKANWDGQYNIAIGGYAMEWNSSGDYNTAIGYSSVASGDVNSSAFGYNASAYDNNTVRIGNSSVTDIGGYAAWSNLSDGRFKTNVEEDVKGLEFIQLLRPVTYNLDVHGINDHIASRTGRPDTTMWDSKYDKELIKHTGFIAQEVEQAAEDIGYDFSGVVVPQTEDGTYALRYAEFVVPLVKAMQEQQEIIEDLQARIVALEAQDGTN